MTDHLSSADLPPCDPNIFAKGVPIFVTHTIRSVQIEPWVRGMRERSGLRIDWHMTGGRAIVLALGDVSKAREALADAMPEHDAMWLAATIPSMGEEAARRYLDSMHAYSAPGGEVAPTGMGERDRYTAAVR